MLLSNKCSPKRNSHTIICFDENTNNYVLKKVFKDDMDNKMKRSISTKVTERLVKLNRQV